MLTYFNYGNLKNIYTMKYIVVFLLMGKRTNKKRNDIKIHEI